MHGEKDHRRNERDEAEDDPRAGPASASAVALSPVTGLAMFGVPHEMTECRHGMATARVAEPAGRPDRCRPGVVGIGDGQLGGGEDRLAVALS